MKTRKRDVVIAAVTLLIVVPALIIGASLASDAKVEQYYLPSLGKDDVNVMVLGYGGSFVANDMMLKITPSDAKCELHHLDEVKTLNLSKYDIILVLSHVFDFENYSDPLTVSRIREYVTHGGFLVTLLQFNYDWLNISLSFERKLVISLYVDNLSQPFYQEIEWMSDGRQMTSTGIAAHIEALTAKTVDDGGFFYPAYGVLSNFSGSPLILDSVSRKPVLIETSVGLGKIMISSCAWDYHLARSDIPHQTMSGENLLLYHVMLYGVKDKPPVLRGGVLLLAVLAGGIAVVAALAVARVLDKHKDDIPYDWFIFFSIAVIIATAAVALIMLGQLYSDVERYYTKLYGIDSNLDGFPDLSASITQLDEVFLTLEKGQISMVLYNAVFWLAIIAAPLAALITIPFSKLGKLETARWRLAPLWKHLIVVAAFTIIILLTALVIFDLNLV